MSAWHIEDKEWMKQRKREWATVSKHVNSLFFMRSEWKPAIKHYFLTGELTNAGHSMSNVDAAPLFALWFHPDDSLDNWRRIREQQFEDWQWNYSIGRLREVLQNLRELPEGGVGSFFYGRDEQLYDFFFKRGLKREHFPEMDDKEFNKHAWDVYRGLASSIIMGLDTEYYGTPNPYNSVNYRLEEWHDAIILAYDPERKELEHLLELLDQTLAEPESFVKERVDLARRVNEVLNDPTLPKAFRQRVKELRERPCNPYCLEQEAAVPLDTDVLVRIIAGSQKAIARIAKLLEEPTNSDLQVEIPDGDDTNPNKCEFLERPQEVDVDDRQLTARYHIVDSKIFENFVDAVHEKMDFEEAYILYGDADEWYFFEHNYPGAILMSKTGEDEEIDNSLQEMVWGRDALNCLIENYG